ncbi:unnamed protein product [Schistosoma margrebowiei]|uniref:Uncharacterized protein n=1 Tax=Schistosoma margrebowiei TaxID=48269 RepID=A0A183LCB8_9TREM|nr:unnamed protein product [Schistosoma margrebowiei]
MGRKPGELRRYMYLLTVVYAKYFGSVGQTLNCQQQPTVGENKPDRSGGRNQEALELDRIHIEDSTQLCQKANTQLESLRPKEKRKTREHITTRNGDRHEKNEQQLDRTRKEGPEQNKLESAGRQPMLHWE